ncbi:GrpB family protein [Paenibacillus psychroresistens]|uniref:GrpB family protein n=1 Tax=Paenibacillus psychroresistens TaxID=1778678 RepID=A0A6B8REV1_9BACL|nr:GrpB family protein [Paenibacillus psychroresistens]QGQ95021.1 GrpB family protein [Paenibacillus psychroresistens]
MTNDNDQSNYPVWAMETVEIKKPDPIWIDRGIFECNELYRLLFPFGVIQVEHIGSTSIPNLPAKPIIDLMACIPSLNEIDEIITKLASKDWHYVPPELDKLSWRRFFIKVKNDKRIGHLHLMLKGEERWDKQLLFRDRLRMNPSLIIEYTNLKRKLAQEFINDREAYTEAKTEFVNRVTR